MFFDDGDIVPKTNVLVFPIKDSCSNLVNLLYRKTAVFLTGPFDRLFITFPKVESDKFIFFSSYICSPTICSILFTFYDPAKSHRFSLALCIIQNLQYRDHFRLISMIQVESEILYEICYFLHSLRFV